MSDMNVRRLYRRRLKEAADRFIRDVEKGRDGIFTTPGRGILDADTPKHLLSLHKREGKA